MQPEPDAPLCLCVELDADFYYLIRSYAERCGLRAEMAQRGTDVIDHVSKQHPAALVFEVDHPGRDTAFAKLGEIKSNPTTQSIPVVVFSWMEDEESALDRGADFFVRKPVMFADFLAALTKVGLCTGTNPKEIIINRRR